VPATVKCLTLLLSTDINIVCPEEIVTSSLDVGIPLGNHDVAEFQSAGPAPAEVYAIPNTSVDKPVRSILIKSKILVDVFM
jgi:hypothetical protein